MVCSIVIFAIVIIMASPTNVSLIRVVALSILTFNAVQFQKPLNTKVIIIPFTLLKILRIENVKLVLRTSRGVFSYAPVAILSWELDVQIFHW
jgi:hypothetical protein